MPHAFDGDIKGEEDTWKDSGYDGLQSAEIIDPILQSLMAPITRSTSFFASPSGTNDSHAHGAIIATPSRVTPKASTPSAQDAKKSPVPNATVPEVKAHGTITSASCEPNPSCKRSATEELENTRKPANPAIEPNKRLTSDNGTSIPTGQRAITQQQQQQQQPPPIRNAEDLHDFTRMMEGTASNAARKNQDPQSVAADEHELHHYRGAIMTSALEYLRTSTGKHNLQANAVCSSHKYYTYRYLPEDVERSILDHVSLLSDAVNLAKVLMAVGHARIIPLILDKFKESCMSNDDFCKEVFRKPEYKSDACTPTGLKPQTNNPHNLTYPALMKQSQHQISTQVYWKAEYHKALVKHRLGSILSSKAYREGTDAPSWYVKGKFGIDHWEPQSKWTYLQHMQKAERIGKSQWREAWTQAREAEEAKKMEDLNKIRAVFDTLTKLMADPTFLPNTCRGCGNDEGRPRGSVHPHCGNCLKIHAKQNMIDVSELATLKIKIGTTYSGQLEQWIKPLNLTGHHFVTRLELDYLCKLYHDLDWLTASKMVANGTLSPSKITENARVYECGARVADAIRQQVEGRRASFQLRDMHASPRIIVQSATPQRLGKEQVILVIDSVQLRPRSPAFWANVLRLNKASIEAGIVHHRKGDDWLVEMTTYFWDHVLREKLQRVTLQRALDTYHVVRTDGFNEWIGQEVNPLDKHTILDVDLEKLCLKVHGCLPRTVAGINVHHARQNLTSYLIISAALLHLARLYETDVFECCIDLIALAANFNDLPLDSLSARFDVFYDYASTHIHTNQTFINNGTVTTLSDIPRHTVERLAWSFIQSFTPGLRGHPVLLAGLQQYVGRSLSLVVSRKAHDVTTEEVPEILRTIAEHAKIPVYFDDQPLPLGLWRCGRVAWYPSLVLPTMDWTPATVTS